MSSSGGTKAILAAFAANVGIAIAKLVAFVLTGATSMLAESIHSFADCGNQGLLLLGGRRALRPPDERHPFGHSSERFFWAFVVALVMFSMGGLFALYEGIHKVVQPAHLDSPAIAIVVLVLSMVLEGFSLRTALVEVRRVRKPGDGYVAFVRRSKDPELPVVLLEDCAALIGLAIALAGQLAAHLFDQPRFDAVGSIGIGILLVVVAFVLARETKSLLVGEAADRDIADALRAAIVDGEDVVSLIHFRTLQLGPNDILVTAKIELAPQADMAGIGAAIDRAEARMRSAEPTARLIFLEPDVRRP